MTAESARDDDMATDPLRELLREAREDLLAWASSGLPADSIVEKRTLDLATRIDAALAQQPEPTYTPAQMAENFRAGMNTERMQQTEPVAVVCLYEGGEYGIEFRHNAPHLPRRNPALLRPSLRRSADRGERCGDRSTQDTQRVT